MVLADQVATRFTQNRYTVVEARLRQDLAIRPEEGEFMLSRNIDKLSAEYKAYAVIIGKYTKTRDLLYLDTQLVQVNNKQILASINAKMPMGVNARDLLVDTGGSSLTVVNQ